MQFDFLAVEETTCHGTFITKAEYINVVDATYEVLWLKKVIVELGVDVDPQAIIHCDNLGASYLTENPIQHATTKHVAIIYHFVRVRIAKKSLVIRYLESKEQLSLNPYKGTIKRSFSLFKKQTYWNTSS